jgi:hypothetical protein
MKKIAQIAGPLMSVAIVISPALGQATQPVSSAASYVGFELPSDPATMTYSLTGGQHYGVGTGGTAYDNGSANVSGNVGILTGSLIAPFSLTASAGYQIPDSGGSRHFFDSISASQQYSTESWHYLAVDSFSYLPETASVGLSGIPGVGDVGGGSNGGDGILSYDESRINNSSLGSVTRVLTGRMSLSMNGSYSLHRLVDEQANSSGLNGSSWSIGSTLSRQVNALNTVDLSYSYGASNYGAAGTSYTLHSLSVAWERSWSPRLKTTLGGGPELVSGGRLVASVQASATYDWERGGSSVSYTRGVVSGGGVTTGATQDAVSGSYSHPLGYAWHGSADVGYHRSSSVQIGPIVPNRYNTVTSSFQLGRALGRHFSCYGSYTVLRQSVTNPAATTLALNGLNQIVAFGITYSPSAIRLARH